MFCEEFQSKLTSMVERETALQSSVYYQETQKGKELPSRQEDGAPDHLFFSKGPPWQVRGQAGQEFSTVHTVCRSKQEHYQRSLSVIQPDKLPAVQPTRPKATLPRATTAHTTISPKTPTEKVLEMLHALPQTLLPSLGIPLDMEIARREAQRPVGARLQHFLPNWQPITDDPWILNTTRLKKH